MANERQTLSHLANQVRMSMSRATVREFDDEHLMQQIKYADVYHSETPSDFERWQMVGLTATPLKQDQDQQQQQQSKQGNDTSAGSADQGDWNHNQPKGKAAEVVMLYLNGSRSHPVGMADDRRVRPYKVPEGATALYAASGSGQMFYHNDEGSYVVVVNNPKYDNSGGQQQQQQKERFASLRHVNKKPQDRNIGGAQSGSGSSGGSPSVSAQAAGGSSGSSSSAYSHEGESVNTEVRCTSGRIEFRVGDEVVGYYDKKNKRWSFTGEMRLGADDASHPVYGVNGGKGMTTEPNGAGAVLVKATKPGPPTSQDTEP